MRSSRSRLARAGLRAAGAPAFLAWRAFCDGLCWRFLPAGFLAAAFFRGRLSCAGFFGGFLARLLGWLSGAQFLRGQGIEFSMASGARTKALRRGSRWRFAHCACRPGSRSPARGTADARAMSETPDRRARAARASTMPGRCTTAMGMRRGNSGQRRQRRKMSRLSLPISQTKSHLRESGACSAATCRWCNACPIGCSMSMTMMRGWPARSPRARARDRSNGAMPASASADSAATTSHQT